MTISDRSIVEHWLIPERGAALAHHYLIGVPRMLACSSPMGILVRGVEYVTEVELGPLFAKFVRGPNPAKTSNLEFAVTC